MNRRDFLRRTAAAVGAFTLNPEGLLYVPTRTYFDLGARPPMVELVTLDLGALVAEVWGRVMDEGAPPAVLFESGVFGRVMREMQDGGDPRFDASRRRVVVPRA